LRKGIYKRKDSAKLWICYTGLDGKSIREPSGTTKFREAETLLIKRKQAIQEEKAPKVKRIPNHTFNTLATPYLKWAERQRGYRSKKGFVNQLQKRFGTYPLRRISTLLVEEYQTERTNRGNKPATVNRHVATLKHMIAKAVDWEMVEEETLKRIRKVKLLEENNKRLRYLNKEECQELLGACDDHLRPIVIMALNTGMRKGEILSLKWEEVDLRHGFILLKDTKNGERREVPINETLKVMLTSLVRRLDVPYAFYNSDTGKPYSDVKRSFKSALRRAKIHDFRFHDLRHTFASQLVMAGADITTIKELLGHKTLNMTLRYAHLAPSHRVKAVELLDNAIGDSFTSHLLHSEPFSDKKEVTQNA
jgi:integrase